MNPLKELRTRWMYWRYRNITLRRQRWKAKRAASRSPRSSYGSTNTFRGTRANPWPSSQRTARTWALLLAVSVAIAVVQYYSQNQNVTFLTDIGILVLAYVVWVQVLSRKV